MYTILNNLIGASWCTLMDAPKRTQGTLKLRHPILRPNV